MTGFAMMVREREDQALLMHSNDPYPLVADMTSCRMQRHVLDCHRVVYHHRLLACGYFVFRLLFLLYIYEAAKETSGCFALHAPGDAQPNHPAASF